MSTAIGIDVGGTGTKGALVDSSGAVLDRFDVPTDPTAGTKGIIAVVERLLARAVDAGHTPEAVGIGAAGFIDAATGSVTFSPNMIYDDPEIGSAVSGRIGVPTVVDNDANAAVWGERRFGAAQGFDEVALLTLGTGVGSGFVVGGRLVRGVSGAGAEFGHTVVDIGGPECPCGLRGCLEQFASGTAIARMGRAAAKNEPRSVLLDLAGSPDAITAEHVARAAAQQDEPAAAVLRRAGRALGIGLSNVANIFDPQAIVLAGSVVLAGEAFLGPARDEFVKMTQAQRRRPLRLLLSKLGPDAGILGAAALALDHIGEAR